jgi:hypothetical protein
MIRPAVGALAVLASALLAAPSRAQPTYKLDVKPNLKPAATLQLDGPHVRRSMLQDDPGFRLQYHFRKDSKTVATLDARANPVADVPSKEAGTYSVVLELFYPDYKGGNQQKGGYQAVSNVLTYRLQPAAKPGEPARVTLVQTPPPAPPAPKKAPR